MRPDSTPIPEIVALRPPLVVPGGRVVLEGGPFLTDVSGLPAVRLGSRVAQILYASRREVALRVPADLAGSVAVRLDSAPGATVLMEVGTPVATGVHQVDSPTVDRSGALYLTCSGSRGQQTPVSVYRVRDDGLREVFVTGVTNATSLAIGPDGRLYVSSRFDGTVSRIDDQGRPEVVASDLGIACGIAFSADGALFVGDRSGTVFRVEPSGDVRTFASLPPSMAAFHLAMAPDGALFVTGPTMAPRDHVYRVDRDGTVRVFATGFGRPQGLAVDARGDVYVVEALAGAAGLYRLDRQGTPELVVSAPSLVGVAFDPRGRLVVASTDTVWRFSGLPA